jgi:hypothetical protein
MTVKNPSVDVFLRHLGERFDAFKEQLASFMRALTKEDIAAKGAEATSLVNTIDNLSGTLSRADQPNWLAPLRQRVEWYTRFFDKERNAAEQMLKTVLQYNPAIDTQRWHFDEQPEVAVDFSSVYEDAYRTSRASELFDALIAHVEAIVASGAIDSVKTIRALEKLIATIRKNARRDYFSNRGAWEFSRVFLRKLSAELLEKVPVLGPAVKAMNKTMAELDIEMCHVHDEVRTRLAASFATEMPLLEGDVIPMLELDPEVQKNAARLLPGPAGEDGAAQDGQTAS